MRNYYFTISPEPGDNTEKQPEQSVDKKPEHPESEQTFNRCCTIGCICRDRTLPYLPRIDVIL